MKTFLRIIAFAKPYHRHFPQYFILALLAIVFSLLNLALLQPLFTVIFETKTAEELQQLATVKEFALSREYFESLFYQKLIEVRDIYGKSSSLIYVSIVIGVSTLLSNLFTYLSNVIIDIVRANVIEKMRNLIFERTSGLHLGFFSDERKGDLMSRMTNDMQQVEITLVSSLKVFFREPATIIVYLIFLFAMSLELTLFTLIFFPVMGLIISEVVKRLKKKAFESQESLGRIVNLMDEVFSGMRIIKLSPPGNM